MKFLKTMIKAFSYLPEYEEHKQEYLAAVERVMGSGWVVLGPEVKAFEEEFANFIGLDHAVGVNSGTDALIVALRALGVKAGSEVITVANTAVPTVSAIRACGANPVFVDIEPDTLLMDMSKVEAAITKNTSCIIPVHLHGLPVDLSTLVAIANKHSIPIVEDCAQCQGASYQGKPIGTFGNIACFSFYPTKNMGAFGDGGLCACNDQEIADRMRQIRMYGFQGDGYAHIEGINSRLDEMQAAILRIKLKHFKTSFKKRKTLAQDFHSSIKSSKLKYPTEPEGRSHAYHLFVVHCEDRSKLIELLKEQQIGFGIHYPVPIHLMDAYKFLGYREGSLPITEQAAEQILSLPFYPGMPEEDKQKLFSVLNSFE